MNYTYNNRITTFINFNIGRFFEIIICLPYQPNFIWLEWKYSNELKRVLRSDYGPQSKLKQFDHERIPIDSPPKSEHFVKLKSEIWRRCEAASHF